MNAFTPDELQPLSDSEVRALLEISGLTEKGISPLSPSEFEEPVSMLWEAMGYRTVLTQPTADSGIDVIAYGPGEAIAIQAKCYARGNNVGVREIREYAALKLRPEIDSVVIVTTSAFTVSAVRDARVLGVRLIDGTELWGLIRKHMLPPDLGKLPSEVPAPYASSLSKRKSDADLLFRFQGYCAIGAASVLFFAAIAAICRDWETAWSFLILAAFPGFMLVSSWIIAKLFPRWFR